jgi:hypothetical protein
VSPPVVVVPDSPDDPLLPLADVVVTAGGDWFARLPGLALMLVPGHTGYTVHRRDGRHWLRAGPVDDPVTAARAAYAVWLADQGGAVSRSS